MRIMNRVKGLVLDAAGKRRAYGYLWYVKGANVAWAISGHESYLSGEILVPGEHFIDCGAHIGRWSIPASPFFKQVTSIEPTPLTNRLLRVNIALNKITNIHPIQKAASDKHGVADFWDYDSPNRMTGPEPSLGANSLFQYHCGVSGKRKFEVELMTLDDLPRASQIKIDVEGAEVDVLKGAKHQLEGHPKLIIEIHSLENLKPVEQILEQYGYQKTRDYSVPSFQYLKTLVAE